MLRSFIYGLLGVASAGVILAEVNPYPDKPLLWKIEGNGLEKPSYLFGTIHLGGERLTTLHPVAEAALIGAEVVYTEISMAPESQANAAKLVMRDDETTLTASIGEELSAQLNVELGIINPLFTSAGFDQLKTWAVAVTVPLLENQLLRLPAIDTVIWNKAVEAGKTVSFVETPEAQLSIFDELTDDEQNIFLSESLHAQAKARESGEDKVKELTDAYLTGHVDNFTKIFTAQLFEMDKGEHKELGRKLVKRIMTDRNVTMAASITKALKADPSKSHFFAFGTGHFVGEKNIGDHLSEQGFKITLTQD